MPPSQLKSANFEFLRVHDPLLVALGAQAERYFTEDPTTCLMKLRQFAEVLAQRAAANLALYDSHEQSQVDLIRALDAKGALTAEVRQVLHDLRRTGNVAAHQLRGTHSQALHGLKLARALAIWFHRSFGKDRNFNPGPFIPPSDPTQETKALAQELERLRAELTESKLSADAARAAAEEESRRRLTAEERARKDAEDREVWQALAEEAETKLKAELEGAQAQAETKPAQLLDLIAQQAQVAGAELDLDETDTRQLIDEQLRQAGWEADSQNLTYAAGARPQRGRNVAIAEWPTASGPADYVLFVGLEVLGVVEAKRRRKDVAGAIQQSKRYSEGYQLQGDEQLAGPWGSYQVPFLFATNGRPYLRQLELKSGIHFLDARRPTNHSRVLGGWYSPAGLRDLLQQDREASEAALHQEPTDYLDLRDYQISAIRAVEVALEKGRRDCLIAMATGTGKTRTFIGLVYRLVKTKRFRRVLFLVDRSALGDQAINAFKHARLKSRILYEQMLGRGTRLCDEIGKEVFRIFDAVDLYAALEPFTSMKPVVVNPTFTFTYLAEELLALKDIEAQQQVIDQFVVKLRRKRRAVEQQSAETFEAAAGMTVGDLLTFLRKKTPGEIATWFVAHDQLGQVLDAATGPGPVVYVSGHSDKLKSVERGYGWSSRSKSTTLR